MEINAQIDATQRELVVDIATIIYLRLGYKAPEDINYFFKSQHPTEKAVLIAAEEVYELITGDLPDYDDEDG